MAKFQPTGAEVEVWTLKTVKFTKYGKCPTGVYPLHHSYKIFSFLVGSSIQSMS